MSDVELVEIDNYSALVFAPAPGDENSRAALVGLRDLLVRTRSVLKIVLPGFDKVRRESKCRVAASRSMMF